MPRILSLTDPDARLPERTGGKGANLARLAQLGFSVPGGYCVTTDAYAQFLDAAGLRPRLHTLLQEPAHDDALQAETLGEALRALVVDAPMPAALAAEIAQAYGALGDEACVAVRSSGTAEDLAEASFAGQHDTYLDVQGAAAVVQAVQRCWASLWTGRALHYRQRHGFDHTTAAIAVVIQRMVHAEVAGVLFTANPLTTATDETVINASWGLGEALVQGIVTPDQFVLQMPQGTVLEQAIGEKELRVVRNPVTGHGVVTEPVPAELRRRSCLDLPMIAQLAAAGARVQSAYAGVPQDIEWAIEGGTLQLLQARPITGVEFSWDAEIDAVYGQTAAPDTVWTRAFADALASGVVTPLTYSTRFPVFSGRNLKRVWEIFGYPDLAATRFFKYWKGELYFNADAERLFVERLVPPPLRPMLLDFIPPLQHREVLDAPFDQTAFLRSLVRWYTLDPETTPTGFPKTFEQWRARSDYYGLSAAQLRELDDAALVRHCEALTEIFGAWNDAIYGPGTITMRLMMSALRWMVVSWYDGADARSVFARLVAGVTQRTETQLEQTDLAALVGEIRGSPGLRRALADHPDAGFFAAIESLAEGRAFLTRYAAWIGKWGHRGHADRDYIYPRRAEDPAIDVRAFTVMMNAQHPADTHAAEQDIARQREALLAAVLENIAARPGGAARVDLVRSTYALTHEYLVIRDNERARPTDMLTFARKRGYSEIGRRLHERGLIEEPRDFHFLSEQELFALFRGEAANPALLRTRIRARARDCDRMLRKAVHMPMCLQRNRPVDLEHPADAGTDGRYRGTATSPGAVTGIARVLTDHSQMARVARHEILVTHSTDPGWNPVFGVISGVVIETGGLLSHAACLAREYGFPAVHLPRATTLIPDGARITVDGDAGTVRIHAPEGSRPV